MFRFGIGCRGEWGGGELGVSPRQGWDVEMVRKRNIGKARMGEFSERHVMFSELTILSLFSDRGSLFEGELQCWAQT